MKVTIPTLSLLFGFLVFLSGSMSAQTPPPRMLRTGTSFDYRVYGNGTIPKLVMAENLVRAGKWEQAILTYDNIVAQWPHWAPVYVKRAMVKYRMGRFTEAQADLENARRLSLNSVRLFVENNPSARMVLLAQQPADTSAAASQEILTEIAQLERSGQFAEVATRLNTYYEANQLTVQQYALLQGNLALLLNDYPTAIAYYDMVLVRQNDTKLLHNRGLARILSFNYVDGCRDLLQAGEQGYLEALEQYTDLCSF